MYYVYLHRRKNDNRVFYVGKGKSNRAYVKSNRSEHWKRIVNKYGYTIEIVFEDLTEQEALQCEIDTILEMRYFNEPLCNQTNGGEGTSGKKISESHKKAISDAQRGRVRTEKELKSLSDRTRGRKCSKEHLEKLSLSRKGKVKSPEWVEQTRKRMLENNPYSDNNEYVFYSNNDVFIGTREKFAEYINKTRHEIKFLFAKKAVKTSYGWSVLNTIQLIMIKEFIK